jgi:ATP-binding cassette subfamily B protein
MTTATRNSETRQEPAASQHHEASASSKTGPTPQAGQGKKAANKKPPTPFARLKPFLMKRKTSLAGSIATGVLATLMGLVPYWIIYRICVGLVNGTLLADSSELMLLAGLALLAVALKGVLTAISTDWTHRVAYDVVYEVRMALADKLAQIPLGYFDRTDSGQIKHTVNEDVEGLEEGIAHLLPDITKSAALPILSFAIMFALEWRMGLAVFAFIAVTVIGYSFVMTRLKPIQAGFGKAGAAVSSAIFTYVYGMKVIRAFSRTGEAFESYAKAVQEFSDVSSEIERKGMPFKTLAVLLSRTALLIVVPSGLWLIGRDQLTVPALVFFILMSLGVGAALFKMLRSSGMTAFRLSASLKNVSRLLEEAEMPAVDKAAAREPQNASIALREVSFAYNEQPVLNEVSLDVPAGTFTALVGPSGAGKTTIARLLPRFWDVTAGSVAIGGADVRQMDEEKLMSLVSFVFQDAYLFRGTIMDNIRYGNPEATDEEVMDAARRAACHDFIAELPQGYATEVGEGGMALSGGQRQRISLVRAILKDAPIIILDEATALVDPENEARIRDALASLTRTTDGERKTILAIAHRLGTIVHADQIVVVDEGRVVAKGTHEELLLASELYRRMWEAYESGAEDLEREEPVVARDRTGERARRLDPETVLTGSAVETNGSQGALHEREDNEMDDPHRRLNEMSALAQSMLLAGDEKKGKLWGVYAFSILENVFVALGSIAVAVAVYAALSGRMEDAWQAVLWMVAMFGGQAVFYYWTNRWSFPMFGHFLTHMRLYLGDRLRKVPYGFFLQKDASVLESRVKSDAGTYIYMPSIVVGLIKGWVIPPMILAAMMWIDWRLALVSLAGVPISLAATWLAERKLKEIMRKLSIARQEANSRILEYIRGIAVIRSLGLTGSRMQSYSRTILAYKKASISINKELTPYTAVYNVSFELGLALVLLVGGALIGQGTLEPGQFVVFLILAICFYEPLPLMDYAVFRRMFMTTVDHMNDIILTDDVKLLPATERREPEGHGIVFRDVTFGYGDESVLTNLNLTIPEQGITALVGPSGGGKTTILNLIARFWDAGQGVVSIGGADVRGLESDALMEKIAFVFQDVYLFNDTVANNIRYGNPDATMEEVMEAARKARCHDFIEKLPNGYDTVVGEGGGLLSGGQKQRISIARAMLKDAPIILLDEATASVDPDNEKHIQEAFEELARDKTVVIIAHRLNTVRHADTIAVIDKGRVAQYGNHLELIASDGIYRRFWQERKRAQEWVLK